MRWLVMMVSLSGCGAAKEVDTGPSSSAGTPGATESCLPTWDGWADGFFTTWCRSCHSAAAPDRRGAPEGTDIDTEEQAIALRARIQARVVEEGTMPVGGGVPEDEMRILEAWLSCVDP